MKTQLSILTFLSLLLFFNPLLHAQEPGGTFDVRLEEKLGKSAIQTNNWLFTRSRTWTPMRTTFAGSFRGMASNFLAEENNTTVSVFFTAETRGPSMEIRAVVDGNMMAPGTITLSSGSNRESRAFIFTGTFDKGIHSIQIEWRSLNDHVSVFVRNASILIRKDNSSNVGSMAIKSMADQTNVTQNNWTNIPNSLLHISTEAGDVLTASIALELNVAFGKDLFVRAVVGGQASNPSDVLFARGNSFQAKTMTFGFEGLPAGTKTVKFQWKVSNGGPAVVQGRSFVANAMPRANFDCGPHMKYKAAPSGPQISTFSPQWQPIPDMAMNVSIPENGEIAVIFSAESYTNNNQQLFVRMRVGNKVIPASNVLLAKGDRFLGVHSFVFAAKHIHAKASPGIEQVQLEWKVGSSVSAPGYMGDRSMCVMVEDGGIPDLAEPPELGSVPHPLGGFARQGGIEPAQGNVPLLAIAIGPGRGGEPLPSYSDLNERLFGSFSTRDYYESVSGGRFTLSKVDIFTFYTSEPDPDDFWVHHTCDSTQDTVCLKNECIQDGYSGGHQKRWAEALDKADAGGFDFAAYDKNKDGVLDPRELAILIITPQGKEFGTTRELNPYCPTVGNPDGRYVVDGVRIIACSEWYTRADNPRDMVTATHELGHLLFNFGDTYNPTSDISIETGPFDLMGETSIEGAKVPHFQGRSKLALGWAAPRYVWNNETITVVDVRKSNDLFILPRVDQIDGKEFYLLENRGKMINNPGYDVNIIGQGVAVWHIVETDVHYNIPAKQAICAGDWNKINGGKARRTARLLRPDIISDGDESCSLWSQTGCNVYDLLSTGFNCSTDPGPDRNALLWADHLPSGYAIRNWPNYSDSMDIDITVPRRRAILCPDDSEDLGVFAGNDKVAYLGSTARNRVRLKAVAYGCEGPYHYSWNTGDTTASIWVEPSVSTTYTVTVTAPGSGCIATDVVFVEVIDARCGRNNNRVQVCYQGNTYCLSRSLARSLVQQGASYGTCQTGGRRESLDDTSIQENMYCKAFPNPFSEQARFNFQLPQDCHAKLEIFNLQGQRVKTLFDGHVTGGLEQSVKWNPTDIAQGLYLYRLSSNAGDVTQGKVNLIR